MKTKLFDAVKFMRKRREELSDLYNKNPELFKQNLEKINKKYNISKRKPRKKVS